jgi:hypothetical protein
VSDEPASSNGAADRRAVRPSHLAGGPTGASPQRGAQPPRGRRSPGLLLVTGTTTSADRILIGSGIADKEQARRLALDWSRAVRYDVTSVRSMRSRDAICSYRDGVEIPVPRTERQPHPRDWDAAMTGMTQYATALQAFAETCTVLSEAQVSSLGERLLALEDACRAVRSAQARAYRDAFTPAFQAGQSPSPQHGALHQDLDAGA